MYGIDGAVLAVMSFYVRRHSTDSCGPNGLPLTPNTVRICGLAQVIIFDLSYVLFRIMIFFLKNK